MFASLAKLRRRTEGEQGLRQAEEEVLRELQQQVAGAAEKLDPASQWARSLSLIGDEIGQSLAVVQSLPEPVSLLRRRGLVASRGPALQLVTQQP